MDEAHLFVDAKEQRYVGKYYLVLQILLHVRQELGEELRHEWPRVFVYTATPVAAYTMGSVLLLNLMAHPDNVWMDFIDDGKHGSKRRTLKPSTKGISMQNIATKLDRDAVESSFLDKYIRPDGSLNSSGLDKWETLSKGQVSSIALYGDRSRFGQPKVTIFDSFLGKKQSQDVACCLGIQITKKKCKVLTETDNEVRCAMRNMYGVKNMNDTSKMSPEKMIIQAPNIYNVIRTMRKNHNARVEYLDRKRRTEGRNVHPRDEKIIIYAPTDNRNAIRRIMESLNAQGFEAINTPVDSKTHRTRISRTKRPYRGFMNLTSIFSNHKIFKERDMVDPTYHPELFKGSDLTSPKEALVNLFNSKSNSDGKEVLIALISSNYREGISLSKVKHIYVAGLESTLANTIQAVARGIRFCSLNGLEWTKGVGWEVNVYLPRLRWNKDAAGDIQKAVSDKLGESKTKPRTVRMVIEDLDPESRRKSRALEYMSNLCDTTSVDRELFKDISEGGTSSIKLV